MSDTCRAVVFHGDGTWALRNAFAVPTPPPGGAVLAVEAVGLCHSDVAQLAGHQHVPGEVCPVVPGHEIVGRVHTLANDAALGVEVGAHLECHAQSEGIVGGAGHDHGAGSQRPRVRRTRQAHVPGPLDDDRLARLEPGPPQPRHHVGQRLEQRQLLGRHIVGKPGQVGAG